MRIKKEFYALTLALIMLLSLAACGSSPAGSSGTQTTPPSSTQTPSNSDASGAGPVTITVWTCNQGDTGAWLTAAAQRFNESQDKYIVDQSYAGEYSEVTAKLGATKAAEMPDIFQSDTEGAYTYYTQPDKYVPIQQFVDEDNYDMSSILGNLKATYTMDGQWQCMPLGNTATGFFYNAEMLDAAGIDPKTDLESYEDIMAACRKLKANGVDTPFYLHGSSSFYSFPMTAQGIDYVDNDNGKSGVPTKSLVGESGACHDATVSFFQIIKDMKAEGLMVPFGTTVDDGRDMFYNGECAIMCAFISTFHTVNNGVGGKFDFGFHVAPTINAGAKNVGQCTGGGVLFIGNSGDAQRERGAWEFMKFLMTDENVVGYATVSGYLPITTTGMASAEYEKYLEETFPTARDALEAQAATPEDCYNAWLPMFTDFHALCREYYGVAYDDDSLSAEEVTDRFASAVDEAIELYNLSH